MPMNWPPSWKVNNKPPEPYELEVSVFGPGMGECVVVHLGEGEWIVVDSCKDRATGQPVALDYLRSMNVDIESKVRLVVATHWHDDHIDGLAEVLDAAHGAGFVNSAAHELKDLTRLTSMGAKLPLTSATRTYERIFEILKSRKRPGERPASVGPRLALANVCLLRSSRSTGTIEAEVHALSPSASTFALAKRELTDALATVGKKCRPATRGANQICIVLWVRVGALQVLLGADLEHSPFSNEGWNAIVCDSSRPEGIASFFKIPHHGSNDAHSPDCWARMVETDAVGVVTPYSPSSRPRNDDISRITGVCSNAYITCDPSQFGKVRRSGAIDKTLNGIKLVPRTGRMGHVRYRVDARKSGQTFQIGLNNGARKLI